ncbi:MAG: NADH-quinone oxidoreductase subunit C [Sulfuricurvum sp.]|uniref:NADH-quinone oxidoreductase subunit C n=1 Tax=Sulfuricurvum sp. TaxID=2025608 RepID=UPI00263004F3|nr:NADH-quinone oxidoreductase subunit C [Sulfuricurvum sp.]MDD2837479.1 NADH-quinone oxidoreductase subunit C [Sulfuricurvum sp.]MDD3595240.1 NADH-quinone oxidoreductase subunit C [Sulfuricurvum sp.]
MRAYTPKDDVQKKPYYTDRYWVAPQVAKSDVNEDAVFAADLEAIRAKFDVLDAYIQVGQMVVVINAADNFDVIKLMKDELDYNQLSEMSAIDWLATEGKFEIFYQMLSMSKRKRVRVKCKIDEKESIESVEKLFRSADWSEREMYDMFGVVVNNHPYMKRILMPDDWEGFPLRKTYPLQGDEFAQWYEVDKLFGKEARDIIGPENRDPARVDRYDTERFARLGHEVPRGADISQGEPDTPLCYQESDGVFLIEKFDAEKSVVISDRDR